MIKEEQKDFYKHNPDKFIEILYGIKLYPYQKLLFRTIYKCNTLKTINRYFTIVEQLKREKQKENYIRGHKLEKVFYEEVYEMNEEVINEVLKPFTVKENEK